MTTSVPATESPLTVAVTYAGNASFSASGPTSLSQVIDPATASMTVISANNPPGGTGSGKPNRFTATLAPVGPSTAQPTGTVNWTVVSANGLTAIACSNGSPSKVNVHGQSHCSVPLDQLTAAGAPWTVSASYSGSTSFAPVSALLGGGQDVHQAVTKSYVTASPNPAAHSVPISISASVVAPSFAGIPTGTFTFTFSGAGTSSLTCLGGSTIGLNDSGGAICSLPSGFSTPNSTFSVSVAYSGDANDVASTTKTLKIKVH
jgi:hypothetical protein